MEPIATRKSSFFLRSDKHNFLAIFQRKFFEMLPLFCCSPVLINFDRVDYPKFGPYGDNSDDGSTCDEQIAEEGEEGSPT